MRLKRNIVRQLERAIANDDMSLIKSIEKVLKKLLEKPENLVLCSDAYKYSHHRFYGSEMTKWFLI